MSWGQAVLSILLLTSSGACRDIVGFDEPADEGVEGRSKSAPVLPFVPASELKERCELCVQESCTSLRDNPPEGRLYLDNTVHVRLNPDTGIEPMYFLAPDYEVSAVIPEGRVATFGHFPNVPPGEYELEYSMDDGECARYSDELSGWPAKDGRTNVTRVIAGADATTYATMQVCVRNEELAPTEAE